MGIRCPGSSQPSPEGKNRMSQGLPFSSPFDTGTRTTQSGPSIRLAPEESPRAIRGAATTDKRECQSSGRQASCRWPFLPSWWRPPPNLPWRKDASGSGWTRAGASPSGTPLIRLGTSATARATSPTWPRRASATVRRAPTSTIGAGACVDLPHDWAVEAPFDPKASPSHGFKAVGRGFPERSVGWYRRTFFVPESDLGRRIRLEFDGVYRNARVFVNGFLVGEEPSGYLGLSFDVSEYLNYGGENVVAVRVDASMEEGWFYEGAGIYRHVWLLKTEPLHVARHGYLGAHRGRRKGRDDPRRDHPRERRAQSRSDYAVEYVDPRRGRQTFSSRRSPDRRPARGGGHRRAADRCVCVAPRLWSLEAPVMHRLVTSCARAARSSTGSRRPLASARSASIPNAGFFLNGQRVILKGTEQPPGPRRRRRGRARRAAGVPHQAPEGDGQQRLPHLAQPADARSCSTSAIAWACSSSTRTG